MELRASRFKRARWYAHAVIFRSKENDPLITHISHSVKRQRSVLTKRPPFFPRFEGAKKP